MPEWIGKKIGKVRIEKLLARGGMAEVYLGMHLTLSRPVAVKFLHSFIEEDPLLLDRFKREATVVAGLRHSNIVQVLDFDTIKGHPYIVMEYLKGPTLATYLKQLHQRKKRSSHAQIAHLLKGLTAGLDYAHSQGVIHRDIKPANILLHSKTDEFPLDKALPSDIEAVLTDFGLVRVVNAASQTTSGILSGTPAYMSPEQARSDPIDHRTDIYSLGIVLYEMLAGRLPFQAESTLTVLYMQIHATPLSIPGISAKIQAVVNRALLKNPDDRYQTSREMANDFYHSIGLSGQAELIDEPYPLAEEPAESPIPLTLKPVSAPPETPAETPIPPTPKPVSPPAEAPTGTPIPGISKPISLPADLLDLLTHDNSSVRKLAVQELVGLLDSKHLGLASAAQEKLREIASTDDSLTLRQIAAQELSARGLEIGRPVEVQNENLIQKPSTLPSNPRTSQNYFLLFIKRLKDLNPLPKLREWKLPLPKLEKRLAKGILGIGLGIVILIGASQFIRKGIPIVIRTPTPTMTLTQLATSTPPPSLPTTSFLNAMSSPTWTRTPTSTSTPTLTATLTPTKTLLPPFTPKPTKKKNGGGGGQPLPP